MKSQAARRRVPLRAARMAHPPLAALEARRRPHPTALPPAAEPQDQTTPEEPGSQEPGESKRYILGLRRPGGLHERPFPHHQGPQAALSVGDLHLAEPVHELDGKEHLLPPGEGPVRRRAQDELDPEVGLRHVTQEASRMPPVGVGGGVGRRNRPDTPLQDVVEGVPHPGGAVVPIVIVPVPDVLGQGIPFHEGEEGRLLSGSQRQLLEPDLSVLVTVGLHEGPRIMGHPQAIEHGPADQSGIEVHLIEIEDSPVVGRTLPRGPVLDPEGIVAETLPDRVSLSHGEEEDTELRAVPASRGRSRGLPARFGAPRHQRSEAEEEGEERGPPGEGQRLRASPGAGPVSMICAPIRSSM